MRPPAPTLRDSYKALLIEDNAAEARRISEMISAIPDSPFALEVMVRLTDGLDRIGHGDVDVLLLDLSLPDSAGLDTCSRAVAQNLAMPIVVLADSDDAHIAIEALGRGAQDYLVKSRLDSATLARAMRFAIQRHAMQAALQYLSLMDELTGLYNRRGFLTLAEQQMKLAQRNSRPLMLAFTDLDDLKSINDRFGHAAGDEAILRAAEALRRCFRNSDIIGRMGGDEFTVLLVDAADETRQLIDQRLRSILEEMNAKLKLPYTISMSVGTARFEPNDSMSVEVLLDKADKALYAHKRSRRTS
ncbi:MAG TPA: diguanylate cyclase [Candidatus Nitrosotenuis sp.]|nr:diguanylate cyclase [Candidatus Nitrosotenuis sp.]